MRNVFRFFGKVNQLVKTDARASVAMSMTVGATIGSLFGYYGDPETNRRIAELRERTAKLDQQTAELEAEHARLIQKTDELLQCLHTSRR